jgi:hypothetical protein
MIRPLLPVFLSLTLLGPLAAGAGAEELPAPASIDGQIPNAQAPGPASPKINDGKIPVTRSDGSTGRTRPPDPKEIRKLVGYMRDGMARADRADRQKVTSRRVNRSRR